MKEVTAPPLYDEPVCDFCSAPKPTRYLDCPNFPMDQTPGLPEYRSRGAWPACAMCGGLIDAENWTGLLNRAVDRLQEKYSDLPRRILTDTVKRSHDLFRAHYRKGVPE